MKNPIPVLLLFIFYSLAIFLRTHLGKNPEYYNSKDPTAYYWTENALQYHYAELVAEGKKIPEFDKDLQAPEGVRIFENLTILMEYPGGWLYRILQLKAHGILFHTWTILYIALVSSLMIFATYFISRALTLSPYYSFIAGILTLFSSAGIGRSIFGFLNEDFALPFIFLGIGFFIFALRKKDFIIFGLVAGFFLGIALASWHFTRFVFLLIILCNVLNIWFFTPDGAERKKNAPVLISSLLFPIIFSFFIPVLKSQQFYLSIPVALGIGSSIGLLLFKYQDKRIMPLSLKGNLGISVGLTFLLISIMIIKFHPETEYQHVWALFINKIFWNKAKPTFIS